MLHIAQSQIANPQSLIGVRYSKDLNHGLWNRECNALRIKFISSPASYVL